MPQPKYQASTKHPGSGLTLKQERFCQEYLIDGNARRAAIEAGYSVVSAGMVGCSNLKKRKIQSRLAELEQGRQARVVADADSIVRELGHVALSNILDFRHAVDANTLAQVLGSLTRAQAACIQSIQEVEVEEPGGPITRRYRLTFWNKLRSIEQLCKIMGLNDDRIQVNVSHSGPTLEQLRGLSKEDKRRFLRALRDAKDEDDKDEANDE